VLSLVAGNYTIAIAITANGCQPTNVAAIQLLSHSDIKLASAVQLSSLQSAHKYFPQSKFIR